MHGKRKILFLNKKKNPNFGGRGALDIEIKHSE
jgi:hypothetical protein